MTELQGMPVRTLPAHEKCQHKNYFLTCEQYEELIARCGNRCEICRLPGEKNQRGKLHIDHDNRQGDWAVRGLLCFLCNTSLDRPFMAERRAIYVANAWYVNMLADHGIVAGHYPEPPIGTTVRGLWHCRWTRTERGWQPLFGTQIYRSQFLTWRYLTGRPGPHNLNVAGRSA